MLRAEAAEIRERHECRSHRSGGRSINRDEGIASPISFEHSGEAYVPRAQLPRYLIAAALIHGRVGITEVADIRNPHVLAIAARMQGIAADPSTSGLTVQLRDGRSAAVTLGKPLGSPTNPVSIQQLKRKFADCARNAVRPLADEVVRDAAESLLRLESISNVSTLLRQFA